MAQVLIYGRSNCDWCEKALDLAHQYGIECEYRNVLQNEEWKQELLEALPDCKTVPQIFWHGNHVGGYEDFATEIENTRNYGDGKI